MTDAEAGRQNVRSLAEKLREALADTGEPPNLDEFTPQERAQIRKTIPLYDTDEKLSVAVYFVAVATDKKGRVALEWMLTFFLALVTIWDGIMIVVAVLRWLKTWLGQILIGGGVVAAFTLDKEVALKWLAALFK